MSAGQIGPTITGTGRESASQERKIGFDILEHPLKSVGKDIIISYARKEGGLADVTGYMRKTGIMRRISRGCSVGKMLQR